MTKDALFETLTENSRKFNKGIESLRTVRDALSELKEAAELSDLEIEEVESSRKRIRFQYCGVDMYARLEQKTKYQVETYENKIEELRFVPVLIWGYRRWQPDGRFREGDCYETPCLSSDILFERTDSGVATRRSLHKQNLSEELGRIILNLIEKAEEQV